MMIVKNRDFDLEIAIPVLNEEAALEASILRINCFRDAHQLGFNVMIADNGSTDNTAAIANKLTKMFPWLNYLYVAKPGVGLALKRVWEHSRADVIGCMDLDLSTELRHLLEVYAAFTAGKTSILNGSRLMLGAKVMGRSLFREISSRSFNFLIQKTLKVKFTDAMCGFVFLSRDLYGRLMRMPYPPITDGWFFSAEVLIKAEWLEENVLEIPVIWRDDPNSKVKFFSLVMDYLGEISRIRKEKRWTSQHGK
jgi:glycosyltransferase involved in cell wall biosynthesis